MALARRCLRQRAWCWRCLLQQRARLRRRALRWSRFVSAAASACAAHPRCGPLLRQWAIARWSRALGTLLKAGTPLADAFEVMSNITGNTVFDRATHTIA